MSDKLDKIQEDIIDIKVAIVAIQKDINYHIMRTDLAEEKIDLLKTELDPISKHVTLMKLSAKIGVFLAGLAAFIATIKSFF